MVAGTNFLVSRLASLNLKKDTISNFKINLFGNISLVQNILQTLIFMQVRLRHKSVLRKCEFL